VANYTKFSKQLLSSKMNNLNYLPIVAEFKEENNDFGSHGGKIELSDEGIKWIDTTRPYGVVIENSGRFENITKPNGESIEYVVCDGYVWIDRYPELNVLFEGEKNNQSMEINVLSGHYCEDGIYEIDDFEYSALCILGKDVIPAFNLARIEGFESKDFKTQYTEMIEALEKYLANNTSEKEVADVEETEVKIDEVFEDVEEETKEETVEEINYQELYEVKVNELNELQIRFDEFITEYQKLKDEFEEYKTNYSTDNSEVERLQRFEQDTLTEQRKDAEESLFSQFDEKLSGIEEYEKLKETASEFELDDLQKECYVILGIQSANFSTKPKEKNKNDKVKLDFSKKIEEYYDERTQLFEKYLKKR